MMTPEERLTRIEENLLAQGKFLDRFERQMDRFERETEQRLKAAESRADQHEAELAEFRATVVRVLGLLERFVSGKSGPNGH
jgi:chromosome segregation ATPase